MSVYDPKTIEEKWLGAWERDELFQKTIHQCTDDRLQTTDKFYALFAFAYPSGSGLHVGHVESKTALDIFVRTLRMQGKQVFFPVGWDAFGLPAENYAIKTGIHPTVTTKNAIDTFRRQIKRLGISYDWSVEIATCHPEYYKWTQWIFTQLFEAGLAYRDKGWVNWCPSCKTVLANEQVVEGACERCGTSVIQKELEQWKIKITAYQDELLEDLSQVDWPKATKEQQKNWIGKSEGALVNFQFSIFNFQKKIQCFTTRLDTIHGVTFVVISPEKFKEYGLIESVSQGKQAAVKQYLDAAAHKTEEQRRIGEKEKTGVDTGLTLTHPLSGEQIPLWIADYVLAGYGTGVVMGVPSLDDRDGSFAKKFSILIKQIEPLTQDEVEKLFTSHPDSFEKKTMYKLRDWLISRQRYWGAPIPMVYCAACAKAGKSGYTVIPAKAGIQTTKIPSLDPRSSGQSQMVEDDGKSMAGWYPVPEERLPVILPELAEFTPTDDGKSPIEKASDEWKYTTCPGCGGRAKREVDTMDTFVDSSWYYLRYASRNNTQKVFDQALTNMLMPVDLYLIGPEHIVLHLLYSRFLSKFLRDKKLLSFDEPFAKMRHQGMILGPDGKKMSKSKGNVINPDDIIEKFGADSLRVYEMFMGPLDADKAWDTNSLVGVYRFLSRMQDLFERNIQLLKIAKLEIENSSASVQKKLHWMIDKVTRDIPELKFNTAIAALMEFVNVWADGLKKGSGLTQEELSMLVRVLAPFAPFLAEELWERMGNTTSVHLSSWPKADTTLLIDETIEYALQVNGRLKSRFVMPREASVAQVEEHARTLVTEPIKKCIVIPGKLVNLVLS